MTKTINALTVTFDPHSVQRVPVDYPSQIKKWLMWLFDGYKQELHGQTSLYTASWLKGHSKISPNKREIYFNTKAKTKWYLRAHDISLIEYAYKKIYANKNLGNYLIEDVFYEQMPIYNSFAYELRPLSPCVINKNTMFDATTYIINSIKHKMKIANLKEEEFTIHFQPKGVGKSKVIHLNEVKYIIAQNIHMTLCSSPEVASFVANVGVGKSTGLGFGFMDVR